MLREPSRRREARDITSVARVHTNDNRRRGIGFRSGKDAMEHEEHAEEEDEADDAQAQRRSDFRD